MSIVFKLTKWFWFLLDTFDTSFIHCQALLLWPLLLAPFSITFFSFCFCSATNHNFQIFYCTLSLTQIYVFTSSNRLNRLCVGTGFTRTVLYLDPIINYCTLFWWSNFSVIRKSFLSVDELVGPMDASDSCE